MSKRTQALLTKSLVLVNKSARTALDASYAVEELCGLIDPLTEENRMLTKHCSKLEKEIDRWKDLMAREVARLKAENNRLRSASFVTAVPSEHYERVIKAGDAMERSLSFAYPDSPKIKEWNAAKEGKQS